MKIQNPLSVTLPLVHPALTGSPLLLGEVFFMKEVWKELKDYPGYYVSNNGRVKSCNERFEILRKQILNRKGYLTIRLCKYKNSKTFTTHTLVAIAFLNHKQCGMLKTINHIDFNRNNNCVENLEIVSNRENNNRKHLKHSSQYTGVSWSKSKNKWESKIYYNNRSHHLGRFNSEYDAHIAYENKLLTLTQIL